MPKRISMIQNADVRTSTPNGIRRRRFTGEIGRPVHSESKRMSDKHGRHSQHRQRGAPGRMMEKQFGDKRPDEKCQIGRQLVNRNRFAPMALIDQRGDRRDRRRHVKPGGQSQGEQTGAHRPKAARSRQAARAPRRHRCRKLGSFRRWVVRDDKKSRAEQAASDSRRR